ncbi:hypothetical protein K461DRAFT_57267 [Myriangium duriaei CBS 260.36]|uniref:Uncharacterized protein n=1 Tax=Myriangium duriaei CBS 260.36 TaxID=1168546 RepID=A0A9P4IWP0_9PEZI|nr:hypothetical protein K461DRAFT_57267 [Myriangium duriaei CBS 260.36]
MSVWQVPCITSTLLPFALCRPLLHHFDPDSAFRWDQHALRAFRTEPASPVRSCDLIKCLSTGITERAIIQVIFTPPSPRFPVNHSSTMADPYCDHLASPNPWALGLSMSVHHVDLPD